MARDVEIDFGVGQFIKEHKKISAQFEHTVRSSLNDFALLGSRLQQKHLRRTFTLRNRWTEGSIFPKPGKNFGTVKVSAGIPFMVSKTGTVQEYLEDQEKGFSVRNPETPTNKARVAGSAKKVITKKGKLKTLRAEKRLKASSFKRPRTREDKIKAMIAVAKKEKFKGVIRIEKDDFLPAGWYRIVNRRKSLIMIRRAQKGVKFRKAERWHAEALDKITVQDQLNIFVRNAKQIGL
jgi:hypothetical protein